MVKPRYHVFPNGDWLGPLCKRQHSFHENTTLYDRYGRCKECAKQYQKRSDESARQNGKKNITEDDLELLSQYNDGASMNALAAARGVDYTVIWRKLHSIPGFQPRPRGSSK
jgi:transposase-like protein